MLTLLVIDDDRLNCDMLQAVLSRQGYHVLTAMSGRDGLALFRKHAPRVTLLDLRMPEMDGLAVLSEIRAHDPMAGVIILGGGATEEQENQARELRVTDFFRKGLSLDMLIGTVNEIARQGAKAAWTGGTSEPAAPMLNESILIVDDEALVRELLVRFLSLRGYHVEEAHDGAVALKAVTRSKPDLILLDLCMPGMTGVELLRSLRDRQYAGGIILLAGNHHEDLLEEAWSLGPQEVLSKPVDLDRLFAAIQLVMVCREC